MFCATASLCPLFPQLSVKSSSFFIGGNALCHIYMYSSLTETNILNPDPAGRQAPKFGGQSTGYLVM